MSSGRIDPAWGDDLMMIADAVGVVAPSGRPHLTVPGDLGDLTLAIALETWAAQHPDEPIPFVVTDHDQCSGCGEDLCGCEQPCSDLHREACTHSGKTLCPSCANRICHDCKAETARWDYNPEERGEWR